MKQKTYYIKVSFPFRSKRYILAVKVAPKSYTTSFAVMTKHGLGSARAVFTASHRQRTIGTITVIEGDLESLLHECHHAARQSVRMGCVSHRAMSRKSYEERIAVAHGCIGAAVMRVWLDTAMR